MTLAVDSAVKAQHKQTNKTFLEPLRLDILSSLIESYSTKTTWFADKIVFPLMKTASTYSLQQICP